MIEYDNRYQLQRRNRMQCDIRCSHCNKLLCKGCFEWLEIKCPRCGSMENIKICAQFQTKDPSNEKEQNRKEKA